MSFYSARKKCGISQAEVARELGISDSAVCQWETGKTMPDARKLTQIAEIYGCSVSDLLETESTEVNK